MSAFLSLYHANSREKNQLPTLVEELAKIIDTHLAKSITHEL